MEIKMKKYSMYIGRWQTWHAGHEWLLNQSLDKGKPVLVAIRDVAIDEKNPRTAQEILESLKQEPYFVDRKDMVEFIIIPDIESVNYGRGVGYDVIQHVPDEETAEISGTKIRAGEIDKTGQKIA
jgi:phosphopantetheine adenylyltransferase